MQLSGVGDFALVENQVYHFNIAEAAAFLANTLTSGPVASCTGGPTNCADSNKPAAPPAPSPDPNQVTDHGNGAAVADECTFLTGGTLPSSTYTQGVTVNGLNGRGNWTFTWTYTIEPNTDPVPAFTAWDLTQDAGGQVTTTIGANIAGESVVVSSQFPTGKYSFSLVDGSGNRVTGLDIQIADASNSVVFEAGPLSATPLGSTIVTNTPGATPYTGPGNVDFTYTGNGGAFGNAVAALMDSTNSSQVSTYSGPADKVPGDARSILDGAVQRVTYKDIFTGNNDGGSDGSALAMAVMDTQTVTLGPGSYTVTLTGTIKGNGTSVSQNFAVSSVLHIITPGCQGHQ